MMERSSCPSPADVERVYWAAQANRTLAERDAEVHAHVQACQGCRAANDEIAQLVSLGRTLEPSPAWERRDEIRTTLLSKTTGSAAAPSRLVAWRLAWVAPLAFAAAAIALWFAWPASSRDAPPVAARRAVVMEHEGARSTVVSEQPDEIVRLAAGKITIKVPVLA